MIDGETVVASVPQTCQATKKWLSAYLTVGKIVAQPIFLLSHHVFQVTCPNGNPVLNIHI